MKNEYKVTKQLFMSWAKEMPTYGINMVFYVVWWIMTLGSVGMLMLCAYADGSVLQWYTGILLLAICVFKLFFSRRLGAAKRYQFITKNIGVTEWTRTIEFTSDDIVLRDHTHFSNFKYKEIKKIIEKDDSVTIYFSGNYTLRLYKDAFIEGTWEDCKAKINEMRQ